MATVAFKNVWLVLVIIGTLLAGRSAWAFDEDHKENINGVMLHFRVRGTDKANPYLLILHGGPGFSAHMFYNWGKSIENTLNMVYLDQRGCGESERLKVANLNSPKPEEVKDYTLPNLVKDIEGVRACLKVPKWYVLGHSWGGMLGIEYVTAHPEHVLGYIHMDGLISQPLTQEAVLDRAEARYKADVAGSDADKRTRAEKQMKTISDVRAMSPNKERLSKVFNFIFSMFNDLYYANPDMMQRGNLQIAAAIKPYNVPFTALMANEPPVALIVTEHYASRDDIPLLPKITVPTLILNGKQDGLITPAMAELAHDKIKNSRLQILDMCGHFPFIEQPEGTTGAILRFITAPTR